MATYGYQVTRAFKSAKDYSACGQYCFVKNGSVAGEIIACSTANASMIGVLQNDPKPGEEATVCLFGLTKVWVETEDGGSPIVAGGLVRCASSGKAIGATAIPGASMQNIAGISLEAVASGSGMYIEMFLRPQIMTGNV